MRQSLSSSIRRALIVVLLGCFACASVAAFGVARRLATPMDVRVQTEIAILEKIDGRWTQVDTVGPANLQFEASLMDMANRKEIETSYQWSTRSKKGLPYTVELARPARTRVSPRGGQMSIDLEYRITYAGRTARVPAKLSTGRVTGPRRALSGRPAQGLLGRDKASFTLVSVNTFAGPGGPELRFECTERYELVPRS